MEAGRPPSTSGQQRAVAGQRPVNRRRAERCPVQWLARAQGGGLVLSFLIGNYSDRGLWLTDPEDDSGTGDVERLLARWTPGVELELTLPGLHSGKSARFLGRVRRSLDSGVAIETADGSAYRELLDKVASEQGRLASGGQLTENQRAALLNELLGRARGYLRARLPSYCEQLATGLNAALLNQVDAASRQGLEDVRSRLPGLRADIEAGYAERYMQVLDSALGRSSGDGRSVGRLALVDMVEMEATLQRRRLERQVERPLNRRVAFLRSLLVQAGIGTEHADVLPFGAGHALETMVQLLLAFKPSPLALDLMLQRFADQVLGEPGQWLELMIPPLLQAGLRRASGPLRAQSGAAQVQRSPLTQSAPEAAELRASTAELSAVAQAADLDRFTSTHGPQVDDSELYRRLAAQSEGSLGERLGRMGEVRLSNEQARAMALSEQFARQVVQPEISPAAGLGEWMRQLLPQIFAMQLKAQRRDGDVANGERVLDLLEFAGLSLAEQDDGGIRQQVTKAVSTIARSENLDLTLPEVERSLADILGRRLRARQVAESRVVEACEGQQRLEQARSRVDAALAVMVGDSAVPEALIEVLERGWKTQLVLSCLRQDRGGNSFEADLTHTRALIDALTARPGADYRLASAGLEEIRERLSTVPADAKRQSELLSTLAGGLAGEVLPMRPLTVTQADPTASQLRLSRRIKSGRARLVDPGDHVTFIDRDGERQTLKVVWRAEGGERFVFVNALGRKVRELSDLELADALASGQAELIEDSNLPLAERAWRRMIADAHRTLAEKASVDEVTDAPNRRELLRELDARLRSGADFALLVVNISRYQTIATAYGEEAGAALLAGVSGRLAGRHLGFLARLEHEDLALVVGTSLPSEIERMVGEALGAVRDLRVAWQDQVLVTQASVGIARVPQGRVIEVESLLLEAATALEHARETPERFAYGSGGASVDLASDAQAWSEKIDRLIRDRSIRLHAQLIVPLKGHNARTAFEVLLRVDDGTGGSPEKLIRAAERHGLMPKIDRLVVSELFSQFKRYPQCWSKLDFVTFNVSAQSVIDLEFVEALLTECQQVPELSARMCVELTETSAVQQLGLAKEFMLKLKDAGLKLALDDFGSGWASYHQLKHLPLDILKIDGAFVKDLETSTEDLAVLRSINEIAHLLNKKTIAEHVGGNRTAELLVEIGIDYAQGYAYGHPEPLDLILPNL